MTDKRASLVLDGNQKDAAPERWPYPWAPDEDPSYEDPALGRLADLAEYHVWWLSMREKYGYPRKDHVKRFEPRFRDWLRERGES